MSHTYLNKVQFIGNTGNNPELRHTREGIPVTNISLAVQSPNKAAPSWFKLVFWRRQAEYVVASIGKGSQLFIEGELEQRSWTDEHGHERSEIVVHVREFQVLHRRQVAEARTEEVRVEAVDTRVEAAPEPAPEPTPASLKKPRKKAAKKATVEAVAA